ncbi:hypothetical protein ACWCOP_06035 [Maricaulaceae bacterium MS644]
MSGPDPINGEDAMRRNDGSDSAGTAFDAAFDAHLTSMFQAAGPPEHDPVFTAHVISELGRTSRVRFLALGGAGATGSAIAGTQLERLVDVSMLDMDGVLGQAAGLVGPEALVTLAFAAVALVFARVLPGGRLA